MKLKNRIFFVFLILLFHFFWNNVFSSFEIPDFDYELQKPSYVKQIWENELKCDLEKEECKINFKFINKENKKDISSKLNCEIIADFKLPKFRNNCNPTTIIIPKNTNKTIKIKIFEKNNLENYKEKEIKILNEKEEEQEQGTLASWTSTWIIENWTIKTWTWNIKNTFDFDYELQRPSYVEQTWENKLKCDSEKEKCKINFNFITLEKKDLWIKYKCEIKADFKLPKFTNNCNPTTITIPENTNQVIKIKVYEKDNLENFSEKKIFINNKITHYLPQTHIQVQWAKSKYRKIWYKNMTCYTYSKCWVNFSSWDSDYSINYKWDFRNWQKYYWYNPKTVYFKPWFYRVQLITSNKFWNRKVENFRLTVKQLLRKSEQNVLKNNFKKIINFRKTAFLEIDKKTEITRIFEKDKKYLTKKINNKKLALAPWKIIKNIFWKWVKKKTITKKRLVLKSKKLVQKKTSLSKKEKLLKKNIKLHISFQKKNLKISWKTFANSKVEIKIGKIKYRTFTNNSWKYSLKINNLTAGKYKILASVFDKKWKLIAQKKSREKIITKKYITQLNNYKYKKYLSYIKKKRKKYSKKKTQKLKIENFIKSNNFTKINRKKLNFNFKIFAINVLIAILSFILINILLIRKKII